jgi:hypothetical protein
MTIVDPTRARLRSCAVRAPKTRRRARRVLRLAASAGLLLAIALIAGAAVAGAVVVVGALVWELWRWERWGARVSEPSGAVERSAQLWVAPRDPQASEVGLVSEGHRAFAEALHAVAAAYLAECGGRCRGDRRRCPR